MLTQKYIGHYRYALTIVGLHVEDILLNLFRPLLRFCRTYRGVLYHSITVLHFTIWYYTIFYHTIRYLKVLRCRMLLWTMYYIIHYTVLYYWRPPRPDSICSGRCSRVIKLARSRHPAPSLRMWGFRGFGLTV